MSDGARCAVGIHLEVIIRDMDGDERPRLDYGRRANDRFERNGWIGLGVTIAVCIVAYYVLAVLLRW